MLFFDSGGANYLELYTGVCATTLFLSASSLRLNPVLVNRRMQNSPLAQQCSLQVENGCNMTSQSPNSVSLKCDLSERFCLLHNTVVESQIESEGRVIKGKKKKSSDGIYPIQVSLKKKNIDI